MIYTDGIHIVADSLKELHNFAKRHHIPKRYFHGVRKGHPHYDNPKWKTKVLMIDMQEDIQIVDSQKILKIAKTLIR